MPCAFWNISIILKFENYIRKQIGRKVFPGISLLVAQEERIRFKGQYGDMAVVPKKEPLQPDTLYDVASLTKPLITALLVAALTERQVVSLGTDLKSIFPELPFEIQIRHLLTHTSGLPAWFPFYLYDQDDINLFKSLKPESIPGKKVIYSCPGYILLHRIIEKSCGCSFVDLAGEIIIKRLALSNTFLRVPDSRKAQAAPTEMGNHHEKKMAEDGHRAAAEKFNWRTGPIRGETHDANSFYAGGTAGNSGLFSTVSDIFRLSLEFFPETAIILKPDTVRLFWKNFTPGKQSHRSLGFKLNTSLISSGGRTLSPSAIGHGGFTGTSLWLEPQPRNVFVLLSNRIHPVVRRLNFNRIKRRLHQLLKRDLNLDG